MLCDFKPISIESAQVGQRLDNVLAMIFPKLSLRARRKLWDNWQVLVDNKAQDAGFRVSLGQIITLKQLSQVAKTVTINFNAHILQRDDDLTFIYKPQGLHSAYLEHGGASLEEMLPTLLNDQQGRAILCNRLDVQTSGIVVVANNEQGLTTWQELENNKQCQKRYVALVQSELEHDEIIQGEYIIRADLDTDKRKKSRILAHKALSLRHTHFKTLAKLMPCDYEKLRKYFPSFNEVMPENLYLMACTIFKGARHQIRAHAAHAGFGLYNDFRYQGLDFTNECFCLHHGALLLPHRHIHCQAPWAEHLSNELQQKIKEFFLK